MLIEGTNAVSVRLAVGGYQFADPPGGWWDNNWLLVRGRVICAEGEWAFEDACLTTSEAEQLGDWLRAAARGEVSPSTPSEDGSVFPDICFTDPDIALGVAEFDRALVRLRIHFSLAAAPPWAEEERRFVSHQFYLLVDMTGSDLVLAADEWQEDLRHFPLRSP